MNDQADIQERQEEAGFWQRYWFAVLAAVMIVAIAGVVGYQYWQSKQIPVMKPINDFTLEHLDGSPFHFQDTAGKVRLVTFIYTQCPDVCPQTSKNMEYLQEKLKQENLFGDKVVFLSVTFDPEHDTPEVLRNYAEKFSYDPTGWIFLRGEEQTVFDVAKQFGVGIMKQPDGLYVHTMRTFLIDGEGNMRRAYGMADEMDIDKIMADMEQLAD
ncbi:SCO family protein [Brevibacillus fulvus]|uniref:Protein SCO1/2 n=1 Tax=Brevibacillus fulvus TaxID=1125967 RepID=A0A938Y460_9BACL|nr:SCO family protein [Brevibacillus fulvus]MBM7591621.1 protein SCO1/2 [Brevibacillus fulvus]